jgi:hypothetical protein
MAPAYRFGKGFIVTTLEQFVMDATIDKGRWLDQLRDEAVRPTGTDTLFDTYLAYEDQTQHGNKKEYNHLLHDVFGYDRPGTDPLSDEDRAEGPSRRRVYAAGFARAMEELYGLEPDAPLQNGTNRPPRTLDVYWGCGQPNNSVVVNVSGNQVVVHVFSTAVPPGFDQKEQAKYLPKNASVVDDRPGLGEVNPWRATADASG